MNALDEYAIIVHVATVFIGIIGVILMFQIMSIKSDIEFLEYLIREIRRCVNR